MPEMTLTEAAKWAGVTRPTIFKALKGGRLSGRKDDSGEWRIDPSELERVYRLGQPSDIVGNAETPIPDIVEAIAAKDREIALLREALDDARVQRDRAMELAEAQTRLLTHQQERASSAAAPTSRRRLLGWFRRSGDG